MTNKKTLSWDEFDTLCASLAEKLKAKGCKEVYGVPKNGLYVATAVARHGGFRVILDGCTNPAETWVVDDLIDSGETLKQYSDNCAVLFRKPHSPYVPLFVEEASDWVVFPWEKPDEHEDLILRTLEFMGEDPTREGLKDTPKRSAKAWRKITEWYDRDFRKEATVFTNESGIDQIIGLRDIPFFSTCEHHLLPFYGSASVYYIPDKKIIGISKLARLVDIFARRLQNQERIGKQIADTLEETLQPKGVAVIIKGKHLCMMARGVEKREAEMQTSDLRGFFRNDSACRSELFNLLKC